MLAVILLHAVEEGKAVVGRNQTARVERPEPLVCGPSSKELLKVRARRTTSPGLYVKIQ